MLVKQQTLKRVNNEKNECVTKHRLLLCDAKTAKWEDYSRTFVPKQHVWKLLTEVGICQMSCETLLGKTYNMTGVQVDEIWLRLKYGLLPATEITCRQIKKGI